MSDRLALIIALELSIARASAQRRAEMALQIADLFVRGAFRFLDDCVSLFDEIMTRLATEVDDAALAQLAQRLAPITNAPVKLSHLLASDDEIKIAYPILAHSARLDDATLMQHAQTKSQKHLLAISWRRCLNEAITDVLIERGNKHTLLSIAKNPGARFSQKGFQLLVSRSEGDEVLAGLLGSRPDILTLLITAAEPIRIKLIADNQHVRHEIDRIFVMIADLLRKDAHSRLANGNEAQNDLRQQSGQLTDDTIPAFVGDDSFWEVRLTSENTGTVIGESSANTSNEEERRENARQKSFLRGYIYFNNRRTSIECHIRDYSHEGARILISASVNIPDIIELYIPQKDQTFRASVRWRHKEEVGLSFSQAATNSAAQQSSELTQRVTQLESEIASLRGLLRRPKAKVGSGRDFDAA